MNEVNGTGMFYSRSGNEGVFGDLVIGASHLEIVMQDDYGVIDTDNHVDLGDFLDQNEDFKRHFIGQVRDLERDMNSPIRGTFGVQEGRLTFYEVEKANLKAAHSIVAMLNMMNEGLISDEGFISSLQFRDLQQLFSKEIDAQHYEKIGRRPTASIMGEAGSQGIGIGRLETDKEKVKSAQERGEPVIYVTRKPGPEDTILMKKSAGIIIAEGDPTAHPVILAKSNNVPCIVNLPDMEITDTMIRRGDKSIPIGQTVTLDGTNGALYDFAVVVKEDRDAELLSKVNRILERKAKFDVYVNADSAEELELGQELGAQGLGLCRTEHMLFDNREQLNTLRTALYCKTEVSLEKLIRYQKSDFSDIYKQAKGQRVVIRLLDPPINEFLPQDENDLEGFLEESGMGRNEYDQMEKKLLLNASHYGVRGIRLGIEEPKIYLAQVKAIMEAIAESNFMDSANILLPFISFTEEYSQVSDMIRSFVTKEYPEADVKLGAMIETPMSAFESDYYAENADFISYGLNDLTMAAYALDRVGSDGMIKRYVDKGIIKDSPYDAITYSGMRKLLKESVHRAKKANPDIVIGVCSEQVKDKETLEFFNTLPITYVSSTGQTIPFVKYQLARTNIK